MGSAASATGTAGTPLKRGSRPVPFLLPLPPGRKSQKSRSVPFVPLGHFWLFLARIRPDDRIGSDTIQPCALAVRY